MSNKRYSPGQVLAAEFSSYEDVVDLLIGRARSYGWAPGKQVVASVDVSAESTQTKFTISAVVSSVEPQVYLEGSLWLDMMPESPSYRMLRFAQASSPSPAVWYTLPVLRYAANWLMTKGGMEASRLTQGWDSSLPYTAGQQVWHMGWLWKSNAPIPPSAYFNVGVTGSTWSPILPANRNWKGVWLPGASYNSFDVVATDTDYTNIGRLYFAASSFTSSTAPGTSGVDALKWSPMTAQQLWPFVGSTDTHIGNSGLVPIPSMEARHGHLVGGGGWDLNDKLPHLSVADQTVNSTLDCSHVSAVTFNQVTPGVSIALSTPNDSVALQRITVSNVGSTGIGVSGALLPAGKAWILVWNPVASDWLPLNNPSFVEGYTLSTRFLAPPGPLAQNVKVPLTLQSGATGNAAPYLSGGIFTAPRGMLINVSFRVAFTLSNPVDSVLNDMLVGAWLEVDDVPVPDTYVTNPLIDVGTDLVPVLTLNYLMSLNTGQQMKVVVASTASNWNLREASPREIVPSIPLGMESAGFLAFTEYV